MTSRVVLVVEDDDSIREVLAEILVGAGYSVVEARDGKQALDRLEGGCGPAVALVDVMMPSMDGISFAEHAHMRGHRLPIIMLSASESGCASAGNVVAFLRKPVGRDEILRTVAAALEALSGP